MIIGIIQAKIIYLDRLEALAGCGNLDHQPVAVQRQAIFLVVPDQTRFFAIRNIPAEINFKRNLF